jgi:sporulation protein YlmC with PRC-barrel domain
VFRISRLETIFKFDKRRNRKMKKYLLVTLLTMIMFFPSAGVFAREKGESVNKRIAASVPEGEHINAFRVEKIIDSEVINLEGKSIGTIDDLVIDIDTGRIAYAVLEFGGFVGFGDKLFAVPWQSLTAVPAEGIFILDQSKAKLEKAPGFDKDNWPDLGDRSWGAGIYEFYRHHGPAPQITAPAATPQKQKIQRGNLAYRGYASETYPYPGIREYAYDNLFDPKTIQTVSGEIVKVEYFEDTRLIVYTDEKKPVLVALAPTGYLENQPKVLRPGNRVTVTGSEVTVDDTPLLIATDIKEGKEELQLRDNEGHPLWFGWKRIK